MIIYCSKPGDFQSYAIEDPVSLLKVGDGPFMQLHCVRRRMEDGNTALVAMNASALPESFEVVVDRVALRSSYLYD